MLAAQLVAYKALPMAVTLPVKSVDRRLINSYSALSINTVFELGGQTMIIIGHSEHTWFLSSDQIKEDGLWNLEGTPVIYEYYCPVTTAEVPTQIDVPVTARGWLRRG